MTANLTRDERDAAINALFEKLLTRMHDARMVLTDYNPRVHCNWGTLDASIEREQIRALMSQPVEPSDAWQPIATAPKDETEILVYTECGNMYVVSYDDLFSAPWRIRNMEGINEHVPTHWQPIPQRPKE